MQTDSSSTRRGGSRSRYIGDVVLNVESYADTAPGDHCYPGLIKGRAMGGLLDGRTVEVAIRKTPTNHRAPRVTDLQDETKLSFTSVGGYLALEGVRSENGSMTAQWLNRMGGPEAEIRSGMPMRISPAYDREGNTRRFKVNGATIYSAQILHLAESSTADSMQSLKESLTAALESHGSAMIALAPNDRPADAPTQRKTLMAFPGWRNQARVGAEETADTFLSRHGNETLNSHLESGGAADVIPMETVRLGSRVCESIDAGAKFAVPVARYMTGGLAARVESALRKIDPVRAARLESAFLARAHPNVKEAFSAKGWKGVWNSDVERFFNSAGYELPKVTRFGFAISTAFLRPYADGGGERFLAKSRALTAALPVNAVPTPSDPEANMRYHDEILETVSRFAESLPESPSAERVKNAAKARRDASNPSQSGVEAQPDPGKAAAGAFTGDRTQREEPAENDLMDF